MILPRLAPVSRSLLLSRAWTVVPQLRVAGFSHSASAYFSGMSSLVSRTSSKRYLQGKLPCELFPRAGTRFQFLSTERVSQPIKPYPTDAALGPGFIQAPTGPKLGRPRFISTKAVAYWLLFSAAAVFGIVILGGLTRLTESGLSITEWRPITGSFPPRTQQDWEREFALYRESPEFKQLNSHITLEEYKFIYYMEWAHRLWGRAIGMLILLPGAYFVVRRRTSPATNRALVGIAGLLGLQGFVGWWMVKSGLDQHHLDSRNNTQPRVSQYRLATHLAIAFLLYFAMTYKGLRILKAHTALKNPRAAVTDLIILQSSSMTGLRRFVTGLFGLAFVTSISGAFVAGLDAGLLYNSFPYMGNTIIPSKRELFDEDLVKRQGMEPTAFNVIWKNMLENPVTVQLTHRILATTTWTLTLALAIYCGRIRGILPGKVLLQANHVFGFATLQAALGITTLIYIVPVPVASLHQAGSMAFLTSLLVLLASLRLPPAHLRKFVRLLAEKAAQKPPKI